MALREDIKEELGGKLALEAAKTKGSESFGMTIEWVKSRGNISGYIVHLEAGDIRQKFRSQTSPGRPSESELEDIISKYGDEVVREVSRLRRVRKEGPNKTLASVIASEELTTQETTGVVTKLALGASAAVAIYEIVSLLT